MTTMAANFLLWFLLVHLLLQILYVNARVPAIVVFGDSSVDSGNNNEISTILKSNFAPYGRDFIGGQPTGRFSNGRMATDFISEAFGIKQTIPAYLDPAYNIKDFATGVCFASAGTGYDNATSDVFSVIPLWKELEYYKEYQKKLGGYLGNRKAKRLLSKALYIISLGTNDFMENYYVFPNRSSKFSVEEYQDFLLGIARDFITELHSLGAQKITVAGLPPMGCLPLERTGNILFHGECIEEYNNVARDFNGKLNELVTELNKEHAGMRLVPSSTYNILSEIIETPSSFGFENAATGCCGTGLFETSFICNRESPFTCSDANKYVFWDAFHPTEKTNFLLADYVVKNFLYRFL